MQCNKLSSSSAVGRARAPLRSRNGSASAPSDVLSKNSRSLVRRGRRAPLTSIRFGAIAVYLFRRSLLVSYPCLSPKRFSPPSHHHLYKAEWNDRVRSFLSLSLSLLVTFFWILTPLRYITGRLVQSISSHCGSADPSCAESPPLEEDVHCED